MEQPIKAETFRHQQSSFSPFYKRGIESGSIRGDPDRDLNEKVAQVKQIYETRVTSLQDSLKQLFELVQNDPLVNTMKQDPSSFEFANQRIKEILEDFLNSEREYVIEKLSTQYSLLKAEYQKVQAELAKMEIASRDNFTELERKCIELEESLKKEQKDKEFYANEVEVLRRKNKELSDNFDELLKKKDAQLLQRSEREINELHMIKQKMLQLENEVNYRDKQIYELTAERNELKLTVETDSLMLRKLENEAGLSKKNLAEVENQNHELKSKVKSYHEQISDLKMSINELQNTRHNLEESLAAKDHEYKNAIESEHETVKSNFLRMKDKYKNKIGQYKNKLADFKTKMAEKEQLLYESQRKISELSIIQEKNEELVKVKVEDLRDFYEEKLYRQEEESRRRERDLVNKNEDEIRELQSQFQRLLDSRLTTYKEEALEQIAALKRSEKELQMMIEDNLHRVERDYIKLTSHEEKMKERQAYIENLKAEFKQKESDWREELASKLKSQEEIKLKELELAEIGHKMIVTQLENQITQLNNEKKKLENELNALKESSQNLLVKAQELESQNRRNLDSLDEAKERESELRKMYENESANRKELEKELRMANNDMREIKDVLNQTKLGLSERISEMKVLAEENKNLREELEGRDHRVRGLLKEIEDFKAERTTTELHRAELVRSLKDQNESLRRDNRELNQQLLDTIKTESERYEREASEHFATKSELKNLESKLQEKRQELTNAEAQIEKIKANLLKTEFSCTELKQQLHKVTAESQSLSQEKSDLIKRYEEQRARVKEFKQQLQTLIIGRFKGLKRELSDLRDNYKAPAEELQNELSFKIESLHAMLKDQVLRKELQMHEVLDVEKVKLNESYNEKLSTIKANFENEQNSLVELLQQKLNAKEGEVFELRNENIKLKHKADINEQEAEKLSEKVTELEEKTLSLTGQLDLVVKEREAIRTKLSQVEAHYEEEIEDMSHQLKQIKAESSKQQSDMQKTYESEVKSLKENIESLKDQLMKTISKYEEDAKAAGAAYKEELALLKAKHDEKVAKLTKELQEVEASDRERYQKVKQLQETIVQLEKEKNTIRMNYDIKLDEYETKLEELKFKIQVEGENALQLKYEKAGETESLNGLIRSLQEELAQRNERINALVHERNRATDTIRELERELDRRVIENERQKKEITERQFYQAKEIESLHHLLSKSLRGSVSAKANEGGHTERGEYEQLSRSQQGLKKTEKFAEGKRSSNRSPLREYRTNQSLEEREELEQGKTRKPWH